MRFSRRMLLVVTGDAAQIASAIRIQLGNPFVLFHQIMPGIFLHLLLLVSRKLVVGIDVSYHGVVMRLSLRVSVTGIFLHLGKLRWSSALDVAASRRRTTSTFTGLRLGKDNWLAGSVICPEASLLRAVDLRRCRD